MTPTMETRPPRRRLARAVDLCRPTVRYCMETEAHVYALAISASVLLSFYPFMIVMLSLCKNVLRWPDAVNALYVALNDYVPGTLGDFLKRNLILPRKIEYTSMFLLLLTANGVFEPLEVALNKVWGAAANRTWIKNQLVSLGLIFLCGGLALFSLVFSAINQEWITARIVNVVLFKAAALPSRLSESFSFSGYY